MRHAHETILSRLGKALYSHWDDIVQEPLPRRWVDLILYLDGQERKRSEADQTETQRGKRQDH